MGDDVQHLNGNDAHYSKQLDKSWRGSVSVFCKIQEPFYAYVVGLTGVLRVRILGLVLPLPYSRNKAVVANLAPITDICRRPRHVVVPLVSPATLRVFRRYKKVEKPMAAALNQNNRLRRKIPRQNHMRSCQY